MRSKAYSIRTTRILGLVTAILFTGCSLDSLVNVDDPESGQELVDDAVQSRSGGIGMYNSAVGQLSDAVNVLSRDVALFTDELTMRPVTSGDYWPLSSDRIDPRLESRNQWGMPGLTVGAYSTLHAARIRAAQARDVLSTLNDTTVRDMIAGAYAIEGYSIVLLGENFCSGIPLSSAPFGGDVSYSAGLSTQQLFDSAVVKFDSALAMVKDSQSFLTLARIGKGRALLGLGEYPEAMEAVSLVQPSDQFALTYTTNTTPGSTEAKNYFWTDTAIGQNRGNTQAVEIVNREGNNGLIWYTSPALKDPRLPVSDTVINGVRQFTAVVRQRKFRGGAITFPLARGVEAALITAESYLQDNDPRWLSALNDARRSVGLQDTTDPGTVEQRVNLLFRERAYWFYMEGVRLSDYRRLVRQYGRSPYTIYPTGTYTRSMRITQLYGDAMVFSPQPEEYENNYLYNGCANKNP